MIFVPRSSVQMTVPRGVVIEVPSIPGISLMVVVPSGVEQVVVLMPSKCVQVTYALAGVGIIINPKSSESLIMSCLIYVDTRQETR